MGGGAGKASYQKPLSNALSRVQQENNQLRDELRKVKSELREMERQRDEARDQARSSKGGEVLLTKKVGPSKLALVHTKEKTRGPRAKALAHEWIDSVRVTGVATGTEKFDGIAFGDGLFVCAPRNSRKLLVVPIGDPQKIRGVDVQEISSGDRQFDGVAYGEGLFVCAPRMATKLLIYDVKADQVRGEDIKRACAPDASFNGVAYGDGIFACAPRDSNVLLLFEPKTDRLWGVDVAKVYAGENKWHGCAYGEGLFVCAPFHADHLLIYDVKADRVWGKDVRSVAVGLRKFVGVAYGDGIFVCAPYASDHLLVYRPATDLITGVDITRVAQGGTKYVGITYASGFFVCAPQICNQILYYFWKEEDIQGFDVTIIARQGAKFAGIAYGQHEGDGVLVCAPHASDNLLIARESRRLLFESEGRGVSLAYLLGDFQQNALRFGSAMDLTFHDLKALVYGQDALGWGTTCPRDGRMNCSLVDALPREHRQTATHFISWVWGYKLSLVLGALEEWMRRSGLDKEGVFLWMCFCCNNQFRIFDEQAAAGADNLENTFERRLTRIGKMVALVDQWECPVYNKRVWTQFEQYTATKLEIPVQMILPPNEQRSLREEIEKGNFGRVISALSNIDAEHAVASFPADEVKVKKMIREEVGFERLNMCVKMSMAQCCSLEFNLVLAEKAIDARPSQVSDEGDAPAV